MGTRRSRHNKGRKPAYKEHRRHLLDEEHGGGGTATPREPSGDPVTDVLRLPGIERRLLYTDIAERVRAPSGLSPETTAEQILAHPAYVGGALFNKRLRWSETDSHKLKILAEAASDLFLAEPALGRPMKAIAWRAREMGLNIPADWSRLITKYKPRIRMEPLLQFPFIKKARPEHAELMRVNSLVPHGYSEDVRADIVQSVMLALFEGTVTLDELEKNKTSMRYFVGKFYKDQRPHQEVQIESRMEDEEPSYSMLAHLNDEHHEDQRAELRRIASGYMDHQPATQVADIYKQEIAITSGIGESTGLHLERKDVRLLVESGEWHEKIGTYATHENKNHAVIRAKERFGLEISYRDLREISDFCRRTRAAYHAYGAKVHYLKVRGERVKVAVHAETGNVMSFIPMDKKYYGPDGLPLND